MADINAVYAGTIDVQNPDVVIFQRPGGLFGLNLIDVYLPDEVRDQIRATNAAAVSTVDAVKVSYNGSTSADRVKFLTDRLNAVNSRVAFIQKRTEQLLTALQDSGSDGYDAAVKLMSTALKLVPVIGSAVSVITGNADAAKALEQYKLQTLIQAYAADLSQLAQIRAQFATELQSIQTTNTDPTGNAPTVPNSWLYTGLGVALLIAFLVWRKRRKRKRSKR